MEDKGKLFDRVLRQFNDIQSSVRPERLQALQDRRFYSITGAQWEDALGQQFENLPRFEVNKIHLSVIRIFNEYRNNRITVNFLPKDDAEQKDISDVLTGLYRADEQDSCSQEAYDNAFEEAVGGGMGAFRLRADFESDYDYDDDEDDRKQRIRIEPIFDADTNVYFDLNAKRQDKSDAKYCYLLTPYTHEAFEAEFGEDPTSWPKITTQSYFDWTTPKIVYVAEYYEIEPYNLKLHIFRGLMGDEVTVTEDELNEDKQQELKDTGYHEVRQKTKKSRRVHKYILSGGGILRDDKYIAGKHIPIVPIYGKRWFIENIERFMGHVRLAKDIQRLSNMIISKVGHIASLSSASKPIFTPEQILGHETTWATDNVEQHPYLLINPTQDANGQMLATPPVGYTQPPDIPPALASLYQMVGVDMQEVLGSAAAGEEVVSNISAKAVELIHNRLDMQAYIYTDNMAKGMKRAGEIWLSMAKDIYVEPDRKMKTVGKQDERGDVQIMKPTVAKDSSMTYENDLSSGDFDVVADVGASFASRKEATARSLINLMPLVSSDPQMASLMTSAILMNMEGEGLDDIREYSRNKLVMSGVVKPTAEEQQELDAQNQNQQPDANTQLILSTARQADASSKKDEALTIKAIEDAKNVAAKTLELTTKIKGEHPDQLLQTYQALNNTTLQPPPELQQTDQQAAQ